MSSEEYRAECTDILRSLRMQPDKQTHMYRMSTQQSHFPQITNEIHKAVAIQTDNVLSKFCTIAEPPYDEVALEKKASSCLPKIPSMQDMGFYTTIMRKQSYAFNITFGKDYFPFQGKDINNDKNAVVVSISNDATSIVDMQLPQMPSRQRTNKIVPFMDMPSPNLPSIFFIPMHVREAMAPKPSLAARMMDKVLRISGGHTLLVAVMPSTKTVHFCDALDDKLKHVIQEIYPHLVDTLKDTGLIADASGWTAQMHTSLFQTFIDQDKSMPKDYMCSRFTENDEKKLLERLSDTAHSFMGHCGVITLILADILAHIDANGTLRMNNDVVRYTFHYMFETLSIPFVAEKIKCFVTHLRNRFSKVNGTKSKLNQIVPVKDECVPCSFLNQ